MDAQSQSMHCQEAMALGHPGWARLLACGFLHFISFYLSCRHHRR